ncbi:MAG: hypothetical protein ACC662_12265, partial [Planctomycetota bacterium]
MHPLSVRNWRLVALAAVLVAVAGRGPVSAEPPPDDRSVLLFPQPNYQGTPRVFRLPKGLDDKPWYSPEKNGRASWRFGSLRIGPRVGVLFQEAHVSGATSETDVWLEDAPDLGMWKRRAIGSVVLFLSAAEVGAPGGKLVRIREHPDGAVVAQRRRASIVGGLDPRLPEIFIPSSDPPFDRARWDQEAFSHWRGVFPAALLYGDDLPWLRVYGSQIVVTIDSRGGSWTFTTKGKPFAEYDLRRWMNLEHVKGLVRVYPRKIALVPGEGTRGRQGTSVAARDYWVHPGGHYVKTTGNEWEVYARGRKVHAFQEVKRTRDFVELKSKTHPLWVRLGKDASQVLDPNRGASKWTKQYDGRWQERPRQGVLVPGTLPVVPTGPAALLRTVPRVLGMTRQ